MKRRSFIGGAAAAVGGGSLRAEPASRSVRIGILEDISGPQADITGPVSVESARLAIQDFGGSLFGSPIELLAADHQNKPDIGVSIARQWYEREGVGVIVDVSNSAIALAVNSLAKDVGKLAMFSSAITDRMTEVDCNGHGLAWTWDTYSVIRSGVRAQMKKGLDSWFILGFDYAAGLAYEQGVRDAVAEGGGKVVGAVRAPLGTTEYSTYLVEAQGSGAKALAITLGGNDMVNAVKQVHEFGLVQRGSQPLVLYALESDVHAVGLDALQGLELVTAFYWDKDEATRGYARRIYAAFGKMPDQVQAGVYSTTLQYLRAASEAGTTEYAKVLARLQTKPIDDMFARNGRLLPNGRLIHDMYSIRVKSPSESKYPYDYFEITGVIPADQAFRPVSKSACPLVRT